MKNYKIAIICLFSAIVLWATYKYVFASSNSIYKSTIEYQGKAEYFKKLSQNDFHSWNDKIIQLTGEVYKIEEDGVLIDKNIYCQFEEIPRNIAKNDAITIRGRVIGFDDLLNEIKLNECIIIP